MISCRAGVIGLSCARRLQREGFNVAIVAKDFPIPFEVSDARTDINYTSLWGGAHNRWILPSNEAEAREHDMARTTFQHMEATLAAHPEAGITFMPGIEYLETPPSVCQNLTEKKADELGLRGFRFLEKEELPKNVTWGCEYQTWCVNPMVYCAFLLRQFSYAGGKIHKVDLKSPQEVLALPQYKDARAVVNASGTGFGDPAMFPTRGMFPADSPFRSRTDALCRTDVPCCEQMRGHGDSTICRWHLVILRSSQL